MALDLKGINGANFNVQAMNGYRALNTDGSKLSFKGPGARVQKDADTVTISDAVRSRIGAATAGTASGGASKAASGTADGTTTVTGTAAATLADALAAARAAGASTAGTLRDTDMDTEMIAFSRAQVITDTGLQILNETRDAGAGEANSSQLVSRYGQLGGIETRATLDDLA